MLDLIEFHWKRPCASWSSGIPVCHEEFRGISVAALKVLKMFDIQVSGVLAAHITHAHCRKMRRQER